MKKYFIKPVNCMLIVLFLVSCSNKDQVIDQKFAYLGQKPPGETPEIFAQGIISKAGFHLHSCLVFSPDGKEVYFTGIVFEPERKSTIHYIKFEGDNWTEPQIAPFSGVYSDDSPVFSPDGKRLYFASTRPLDENDDSNDHNFWYVEKTGENWGEPVHAGSILNSEYCDFRIFISGNQTIYLSSDRDYKDGRSFDIFVSRFSDGEYSIPEKIGNAITTPITEQICFISPDESYIVFYRYTRDNLDNVGLYISFRDQNSLWTKAENMGDLINAPAKSITQDASLSPDGKYMFFLKRYEESIYWVSTEIIEELRPEELKQEQD